MTEDQNYFERIRAAYFSDPEKRTRIPSGTVLLRHGHGNKRLHFVLDGEFVGTIKNETLSGEEEDLELFRVGPNGFIGVHSFFSHRGLALTDVRADTDSELAWIDHDCLPVDKETYGGLKEQFFPIILDELDRRQLHLCRTAREREDYVRRLHIAEDMAILGQFAAGLAHELNNAIGVLRSSSEHLRQLLQDIFFNYVPDMLHWFERGAQSGHGLSSSDIRAKARALVQRHSNMSYTTAKNIIRMTGGGGLTFLPANLDEILAAWEAGKSCHDMQFASAHAVDIIRSIRQLSSGSRTPRAHVSIKESLQESLSLLEGSVQGVDIKMDLPHDLPTFWGSKGELVQVWMNIIKNALEALRDAHTPSPRVSISATHTPREICVRIANNGPPIPDPVREKLFQPNITTKTGSGNSMGLGLGLYIARRFVDSYNGKLELGRGDEEVSFVICLPLQIPDEFHLNSSGIMPRS